MLEKKTLISALMATTLLSAGGAYAADQAAQPTQRQTAAMKDAGKLSADGTRAYNDIALTRLAIFDGRVADAKKFIDEADTAFDKAKSDESVFMKAESELKSPDGSAAADKASTGDKGTDDASNDAVSNNAAKQESKAKAYDSATPKRWLPVDAEMTVDEDFAANAKKAAAVADANKSLAKGDKQGAMEKLKLAEVNMTYIMAVVPLDQTLADVHKAAQMVDGGKYYEASQILRQVQDSTRYDVLEASGMPTKADSGKADSGKAGSEMTKPDAATH